MAFDDDRKPPPSGAFNLGLALLGAIVGMALGFWLSDPLFEQGMNFQFRLTAIVTGACFLGLGGWWVRWGQFPWLRALGLAVLVGCLSYATYLTHPPSPQVPIASVRGTLSQVDASQLRIGDIDPAMTGAQILKQRGKPAAKRTFISSEYGLTIAYSELTYRNPDVVVLLVGDSVVSVSGPVLTLKGVPLLERAESREKATDVLGPPTTSFGVKPDLDQYTFFRPQIIIEHSQERIVSITLEAR